MSPPKRKRFCGAFSLLHWVFVSLILSPLSALADGDFGFNYQAEIRDANGAVIVGEDGAVVRKHTVEIRLYSTKTGGDALWGHSYDVTTDDNGFFSVYLSDSYIASVLRDHAPGGLYVGLTVGGGTEILPRQRLCATPYATVAKNLVADAKTLGALTVNGGLSVGGTLKANAINIQGGVELISVPVEAILPWTKDAAPDGYAWENDVSNDRKWAKCTGQTVGTIKTPDLRGRFVVGAGSSYSLDNKGGEEKVRLDAGSMAGHSHKVEYSKSGIRRPFMESLSSYYYGSGVVVSSIEWKKKDGKDVTQGDYESYIHPILGTTTKAGGDSNGGVSGHENLPPYYALYYIMRVK